MDIKRWWWNMPIFLPRHFWTNQRCQWLSWGRRWRLSPSPWQPRCPSQLRMLMTPRRRRGAAAGSFALGPSWSPPCSGQSGRRAERFKSCAKMIDDFVTLTTMTEKRSLLLRSSCVSRSASLSRLSRVSSLVWAYSSPYFRTWEQTMLHHNVQCLSVFSPARRASCPYWRACPACRPRPPSSSSAASPGWAAAGGCPPSPGGCSPAAAPCPAQLSASPRQPGTNKILL